jgi:2-oxo-4-hydroxy-4-carboxy-5-ureidoimidazoline decarboxylase
MTSLTELNTCDRATFVEILGGLFEDSPWVAEDAFDRRPFRDAEHLHAEMCAAVREAPPAEQLELIRAHPDLAGRVVQDGRLTTASAAEQASAGLDSLSLAERADLQLLNAGYRVRFGFPFLLCVRGKDVAEIKATMERRFRNRPEEERATALAEIEKIAWLRLQDVLEEAG